MDEGRKRVLLIAACILAARKLAQIEPGAQNTREYQRRCGLNSMGGRDHAGD